MYRSIGNKAKGRLIVPYRTNAAQILKPSCDVFISHRGVETKRSIAALLHDYLLLHGVHSFLDHKTLMPGEKISDKIELATRQCKVGVPIFSPRYVESWHCLYELAVLVEAGKRLVPIFWDVVPSQLSVPRHFPARHAKRFRSALDEARDTVGLTFISSTGDWSELASDTCDSVQRIFLELDQPKCP